MKNLFNFISIAGVALAGLCPMGAHALITGLGPKKNIVVGEIVKNPDGSTFYLRPRMEWDGRKRVLEDRTSESALCQMLGHRQGLRSSSERYRGLADAIRIESDSRLRVINGGDVAYKLSGVQCADADPQMPVTKHPLISAEEDTDINGNKMFREPLIKLDNGVKRNIGRNHAIGVCRALGFKTLVDYDSEEYNATRDLVGLSDLGAIDRVIPWLFPNANNFYISLIQCKDPLDGPPPPAPAPAPLKIKRQVIDPACELAQGEIREQYEALKSERDKNYGRYDACYDAELRLDAQAETTVNKLVQELKEDEILRGYILGLDANPKLESAIRKRLSTKYLNEGYLGKGLKIVSTPWDVITLESSRLTYSIGVRDPQPVIKSESCAKKYPDQSMEAFDTYLKRELDPSCFNEIEVDAPAQSGPSQSTTGTLK